MKFRKEPYLTRVFVVLIVFMIILLISGCSNAKVSTKTAYGKIIPAELSQSEKQLLNAVGVEKYFVFRVSLPKGENGLAHYWIDYYHNGLSKKIMEGKTSFKSLGEESDEIVLATLASDPDANTQDWIISYISNGGISRLKAKIPKENDGVASTSASTTGADIVKEKPVILAVIAQNHSVSINIPESLFAGDETALKDLLSSNESVYILCLEITDETK